MRQYFILDLRRHTYVPNWLSIEKDTIRQNLLPTQAAFGSHTDTHIPIELILLSLGSSKETNGTDSVTQNCSWPYRRGLRVAEFRLRSQGLCCCKLCIIAVIQKDEHLLTISSVVQARFIHTLEQWFSVSLTL